MVRIVYVINYIVKNGPSSVVLNLIHNLDKSEYEVTLITLFNGNDTEVVQQLKKEGVAVCECKHLSRMKCILGQSREFTNMIKSGQFDILHSHGFIPDVLSSYLKFPIKKITTLHNNMYEDYLDTYGYIKSRAFIAVHLDALKKLDVCVCCSKSVYQVMKNRLKNTLFIRNGIEPASAKTVVTRKKIGIPADARVFLYAGVLTSRKNTASLVKNFVQCHNEREYLLVLGEGEEETQCREASDNHVRILGFQSDPIAYMNISDIYTSASKSEGFSVSVLEALSCGLGLFLSDIPSHREVVEMGQKLYVGETFLPYEFADKIGALRERKFETNTIKEFQERFLSAKSMTEKYEKLYQRW